jgi:hypothetical protein
MMRSLVSVFVLASIAGFTDDLPAQGPDPAAAQAAIARLEFMVGRWRGEAWQLRGTERVQTQMLETVDRKLGGTVLLVEGLGTIPGPNDEDRIVHHALGVISFDPGSSTYRLRSYLATGQAGDFTLTLVDDGVSWTRDVPGGTVRNTARFAADEWHEIGEFSRDGVTWTQVMELRLRRER